MSYVAVAVAGSALVGAAVQQDSAHTAAKTQAQSGSGAIAVQKEQNAAAQNALQPYQDFGQAALFKLGDALGINQPSDWKSQLKQGYADVFKNNPNLNPAALDSLNKQIDAATSPTDTNTPGGVSVIDFARQMGVPNPGNMGAVLQAQANPASAPGATSSTTGSLLKPFSFDISQDPGYQFRKTQGENSINNSASATGSQLSGATMKELLKYGSDYASGEYNAAFSRDLATKNQVFSELTGAAGIGTGATTTGVSAGQAGATNIGNTTTGIGNATAAGQIGTANAISSGAQSTGQAFLLQQAFANKNPGVNNVNQGVTLDPSAFAG